MKDHNDEIFTVVKGTRVYWDEDHDERVIPVVSALIDAVMYRFGYNPILAVEEHEGSLTIIVDSFAQHVDSKPPEFLRLTGGTFVDHLKKIVEQLSDTIVCDYWFPIILTVQEVPFRTHEPTFPFLNSEQQA